MSSDSHTGFTAPSIAHSSNVSQLSSVPESATLVTKKMKRATVAEREVEKIERRSRAFPARVADDNEFLTSCAHSNVSRPGRLASNTCEKKIT